MTVVEIIKEQDRKARKPHICDYCGGTIEAGEIYNPDLPASAFPWEVK